MPNTRIFLASLILFSSCIEFSMTEEEVKNEFSEEKIAPKLEKIKVGDRTIHYAAVNRGKENLIVFIHGSPGSWTAFIDYFKNDSLLEVTDIVSIDRPGFGYSDRGWAEPSMAQQSLLMEAVTNEFSHPRKILIGHSLGGPVIARMAMDFPDQYSGLLFLAPSIDPNMEKEEWYRDVIRTKVGGWVTPEDFWVSNEEILPLKEELEQMVPLWEKIRIPSVVIHGGSDRLVPKENADFAAKMLIDSLADIRILPESNHFLPWSREKEIIQAIYDLLEIIPR